jgi:hypothetical protein
MHTSTGNQEILVVKYKAIELINDALFWQRWTALPTPHSQRFFATETVLKSWISGLHPSEELWLSCVYDVNDTSELIVGMAIFGEFLDKIVRHIPCKTLTLLRSGDERHDQIWPEYVMPRYEVSYGISLSHWWAETLRQTGCVKMESHVLPVSWLKEWSKAAPEGLKLGLENIENGYARTLTSEPVSFGRSIRRQCKQTEVFAKAKSGFPITLAELRGDDALLAMEHASKWHVEKWSATETPSGFENEAFVNAIRAWVETSDVRVFVARFGELMVGLTIVLDAKPWAGFYLACMPKMESNHWHGGVWMHTQIIDLLSQEGYTCYDFMAGEARYKKQLSDYTEPYARGVWVSTETLLGKLTWTLISPSLSGNIIK